MGVLQNILSKISQNFGKNSPEVFPITNNQLEHSIALPGIPAYRHGLLFFSDEKSLNTKPGLCINIAVNPDGNINVHDYPEPSTIYKSLPISKRIPSAKSIPKLPYYPDYARMNPDQRALYLAWLRDITAPIEMGFVFVYYYGLERHLVYGNFDAAVDEILLLRKHHDNSSFQSYSATALVHACLLRRRIDTLQHLYLDLNFDYFGNSVLLILHQQNLDLLPDMLIRLAMKLSGVNKRYLKEKCQIYHQSLLDELQDRFGKKAYPFASNYQLDKVKGVPYPIFANISFTSDVRAPSLSNLLDHKPFQNEFEDFFQRVHEKTKQIRKPNNKLKQQVKALPNEPSVTVTQVTIKHPRKPRRSKEEIEAERAQRKQWLIKHNKQRSIDDRTRQIGLGITHYRWQTAGDERTCPACAANDGKIFSWNEPPPKTGHPGEGRCCVDTEGYCRCVAIPHFDMET